MISDWIATVRGDARPMPDGRVESSVYFAHQTDPTLSFPQSFQYPPGDQAALQAVARTRILAREAELDKSQPAVPPGTILSLGAPSTGPAVVVGLPVVVNPLTQQRTDFDTADAFYNVLLDDVRKGYIQPDDSAVLSAQKQAQSLYDPSFRSTL